MLDLKSVYVFSLSFISSKFLRMILNPNEIKRSEDIFSMSRALSICCIELFVNKEGGGGTGWLTTVPFFFF